MDLWRRALEGLGMMFGRSYHGRRVLVTGHTGFKGSWLCLWLKELGAHVSGIALDAGSTPNHFDMLKLEMDDRRIDIRNSGALVQAMHEIQPEFVFHLAAQPLVRRSYQEPLETWSTNVMGTANLLEACRHTGSVKAVLVVTTDKCYQNQEWDWGYRENDRLGGHDPYSASKAATELLVASYRDSYFSAPDALLLASARAGNVIGGGDWSQDRLIPDLVRAQAEGGILQIRSPHATRPWQHVLESLSGYLLLGQKLLQGEPQFAQAWNFGPDQTGNRSVEQVLSALSRHWNGLRWEVSATPQPHEAGLLQLDISKARRALGWNPVWGIDQALEMTAAWYRLWLEESALASEMQLARYVTDAREAGACWVS